MLSLFCKVFLGDRKGIVRKFYLALVNHGLPALLHDGPVLAAMITGQDYIGIVPEGIIPRYCHGWFPQNEKFLEYMNLPWENAEAVARLAKWYR
jgi:hypothetical protein